jgi:phosphoribosylanthranilate isomerase
MVRVKICGITNFEDALASVEAGAYALGFNFFRDSPRYIEPSAARRIIDKLPTSVLTVGVFVNKSSEEVMRFANAARVRAVQLHGDESPAYCRELQSLFVIKALRVSSDFEPEKAADYETGAILLDGFTAGAYGGAGQNFDWSIAARTRPLVAKLFLAGGLNAINVAEAIACVQPYAVDVCSALEITPGKKDQSRVRAFIDAARKAGSLQSNL